jgi:hypothetical protein
MTSPAILTEKDRGYSVHLTHCCPGHCKYGEVDSCPVAQKQVLPTYRCEDCTCLEMNPEALPLAEAWLKSLTAAQKVRLYLRRY